MDSKKRADSAVVVVKSPVRVFPFSSCPKKEVVVPPGTYTLRRVPNPISTNLVPWLVLAQKGIGMSEEAWKNNSFNVTFVS